MSFVARRCRPLLGTLVEIRIEGPPDVAACAAIEAAFAEIAHVHRLMSFHQPDSDVSRLHRAPVGTVVRIDPRTSEVLAVAYDLARRTQGTFDITTAAQLVRAGVLPRPVSPFEPDPAARWSDIELLPGSRVRLARPLWLDLGGIAKGYAVDRAVELLQRHGAAQICVNGGGDLRVAGARAEPVHLRAGLDPLAARVPDIELHDGAVATSAGVGAAHVDGRTRITPTLPRTVSVLAPRCVHADALTKVVLAGGGTRAVATLLKEFEAQACVHDAERGWLRLERAA
jgi:thiamine biosynthesis lipoprotein